MNLTVSFRKDEVEKLNKIMEKFSMTRHEAIKFCLRKVLFPEEPMTPLNHRHIVNSHVVEGEIVEDIDE